MKKHFLFVCASGARALRAVKIYENSENIETRAAGFHPFNSSLEITGEKIKWASIIFVMDEKHEFQKTQLLQQFPEADEREIIVLGVSHDLYNSVEELDEVLKTKLKDFL